MSPLKVNSKFQENWRVISKLFSCWIQLSLNYFSLACSLEQLLWVETEEAPWLETDSIRYCRLPNCENRKIFLQRRRRNWRICNLLMYLSDQPLDVSIVSWRIFWLRRCFLTWLYPLLVKWTVYLLVKNGYQFSLSHVKVRQLAIN